MNSDIDLDVVNSAREFKDNDDNGLLYVRYEANGKGFFYSKLTEESALQLFYGLLTNGILKYEIMDAVLNHIIDNKEDYNIFIKAYKELKNG
jgi:hypothetical protein